MSYIKSHDIDTLQLLKYINDVILYNGTYNCKSKTLQENLIVSNENIILGTGILLRHGLLKGDNEGKIIISHKIQCNHGDYASV